MNNDNLNDIVAVITKNENKDKVGGGAPIFIVNDDPELEEMSMLLSRITLGMVHDIGQGIKIIIRH